MPQSVETAATSHEIEVSTLKDVGEGYRILTREGLLSEIQWVDWTQEDGVLVEVVLADDSELTGPGATQVRAIWHENAELVTPQDLAASPSVAELGLTHSI